VAALRNYVPLEVRTLPIIQTLYNHRMLKKKLIVRSGSVVVVTAGLFGLFLEQYWLTDKSYRLTVEALGTPRDHWITVTVSVILILAGFVIFILSFRRNNNKK
jgi:prolipoprotein diacylglyceryltransferase